MTNCLRDFETVPRWAKFEAITDTDFVFYFDNAAEAEHYARLNTAIIRDLSTGAILINTLDYKEG